MSLTTACTPNQVKDWWDGVSDTPLDAETLDLIVEATQRDCLPEYASATYVECAISDAWHNYEVGAVMSLDRWAALAWCESNHDPYAQNRRSSASGLYQFLDSTWRGVVDQSGLDYGLSREDQYHARQNAFAAAWYMVNHGPSAWVCKT